MDDPVLPPPLSEAQMEIMNVIWEQGECTLGEIHKTLSSQRQVTPNTIQTLLTRLVDKGWLRYRAEGKVFHYSAVFPRETTLRQVVQRLVNTAFQGSAESLVLTLLESETLTKDKADRIRALIEKAERSEP
jgi:BlaI family transcriptional regulator, penicillinase repressor